jgi:mRNA interferase HigB
MRVHLIKEKTIRNYVLKNAGSHLPFGEWLSKLKRADWQKPSDIQQTFCSADLLGKGSPRVIFDIGGNNYRMICQYAFGETEVHLFVCWIGTHAEYNKICGSKMQYSVNVY